MSSDDSNDDSNRSFDQNRKGATTVCNPQIRSLLSDWYSVPEDCLINVESAKDGEYAPGVNDIIDRLDYRGVDWIVPKDGELIPVGERLRTGERGEWRDMTLRTQNGTGAPSEGQTIPDAIEGSGIYPRDYVLAVREQWDVHRAVLLNTAAVIDRAQSPAVETGCESNDDGSAYRWFRLFDLLAQGCHREVWLG
jgi:hypothetical protein